MERSKRVSGRFWCHSEEPAPLGKSSVKERCFQGPLCPVSGISQFGSIHTNKGYYTLPLLRVLTRKLRLAWCLFNAHQVGVHLIHR
eukprot:720953-Pelagomonas_calceolata.AAC.1